MIHNIEQNIEKIKNLLSTYLTPDEIKNRLELIEKINQLKKEKNAVILGHNYMTPDVFYGVSDFTGDSLYLSEQAAKTNADIIIFNGVYFMAETAKILNPEKKVLIADETAGCSLSESVKPEQLKKFRRENPGIPVISYINSSAEVKALSDIICTSANAVKVINSVKEDTVLFLPDSYLAANVQKETSKKIITWNGKCMVHELFTPFDIELSKKTFPGVHIIAHPECNPEITKIADFTGSTSQIQKYVEQKRPDKIFLLTECSMGENIKARFPEIQFVSTCQMCPHMKKINLDMIYHSITNEKFEINVEPEIIEKARISLNRMFEIN